MDYQPVALTDNDWMVLNSYKNLVDGLAEYLGKGCEIVLHSLENPEKSAIKVVNGEHTGRKEGAPITDLALQMLSKIEHQDGAGYISYFNRNRLGEPLKSATIAIRGEGQRIIGLLCINFYLNTPLAELLEIFSANGAQASPVVETFVESSHDLIQSSVEKAKREVELDFSILPSMKNREIVARLYSHGIFQMKDSVSLVAKAMGLSKNTVYLHLRNLNKK